MAKSARPSRDPSASRSNICGRLSATMVQRGAAASQGLRGPVTATGVTDRRLKVR